MGSVVDLAAYRARNVESSEFGPAYFCTRCSSDQFYLHTSGDVRCSCCNAVMRNISVIVGRLEQTPRR